MLLAVIPYCCFILYIGAAIPDVRLAGFTCGMLYLPFTQLYLCNGNYNNLVLV